MTPTTERRSSTPTTAAEFGSAQPAIGWTGDRSTCWCRHNESGLPQRRVLANQLVSGDGRRPGNYCEHQSAKTAGSPDERQNSKISHSPTQGAFPTCFTSTAAAVAGESNLYLGKYGADAITGYMNDPGSNNASVGHRNWVLHPPADTMGTGDISTSGGWSANVLWVFDDVFGAQPDMREATDFVAWPPRGFVPGDVVYPRWSFSLRDANFGSASVTVTKAGSSISSPVVYRSTASNTAPFPLIVWEPAAGQIDLSPAVDQTYTIKISGVKVGGQTKTFTYDVTIIGDAPSGSYVDPVSVHGAYVRQAYQDFLGRAPEPSELATWSDRLASGTSPLAFVDALSNSTEWTGFVVDSLYRDTLGRGADAEGQAYPESGRLQEGLPVATLAASFYGSQEYVNRQGGTYDRWVGELYAALLGRAPDAGVRTSGHSGRRMARMTLPGRSIQSRENRIRRVTALYQQFLGRNPDPGGLNWWTDVLESGDDLQLASVPGIERGT
ncbi:MAG: DUF4214 domain-containing protein [Acidimicrobiales bacterium]